MGLKTFGLMGVDWEERVDLERDLCGIVAASPTVFGSAAA